MTKLNRAITFVLQFSKTGFSLETSHSSHLFYNGSLFVVVCVGLFTAECCIQLLEWVR